MELLELAERCEKAGAGEQERLIEQAWDLCRPRANFSAGFDRDAERDDLRRMLYAGAYESAALTLVPEGWRCGFEMGGQYDSRDVPDAWCWPFDSTFDPDWQNGHEGYRSGPDAQRGCAATPALALCAAALRARAAQGGVTEGRDGEAGSGSEATSTRSSQEDAPQ